MVLNTYQFNVCSANNIWILLLFILHVFVVKAAAHGVVCRFVGQPGQRSASLANFPAFFEMLYGDITLFIAVCSSSWLSPASLFIRDSSRKAHMWEQSEMWRGHHAKCVHIMLWHCSLWGMQVQAQKIERNLVLYVVPIGGFSGTAVTFVNL